MMDLTSYIGLIGIFGSFGSVGKSPDTLSIVIIALIAVSVISGILCVALIIRELLKAKKQSGTGYESDEEPSYSYSDEE